MDLALSLKTFTSRESSFTLFLAPPAWGKTSILLKVFTLNQELGSHYVFVSPLRALAIEFYKRMKSEGYRSVFIVNTISDMKEKQSEFLKGERGFIILTPETMGNDFLDIVSSMKNKPIFIFDEFHLYYYWGEGFRPLLWEICMGVANSGASILGLSATMEDIILKKWKSDFSLGMKENILIDLGNQKLLNKPVKVINFNCFDSRFVTRQLINDLKQKESGTFLLFCKYRREVDQWIDYFQRSNVLSLGCKGGEVAVFIDNLEKIKIPRVIVSTSALSHGVNLPVIRKVYINYPVRNIDFWNQMVGRGGRNGDPFEVYQMDTQKGVVLDLIEAILNLIFQRVSLLNIFK